MAPKSQNKRTLKSHFYHFRRKVLGYTPSLSQDRLLAKEEEKKEPYLALSESFLDKQDGSNEQGLQLLVLLPKEDDISINENAPLPIPVSTPVSVSIENTNSPSINTKSEEIQELEKELDDEIAKMDMADTIVMGEIIENNDTNNLEKLCLDRKDNGLTDAIFLSVYYMYTLGEIAQTRLESGDPYLEYAVLDNLIRLFKRRRDFPQAIRLRLRTYLESLTYDQFAAKQVEQTYQTHEIYVTCMNDFIRKLYNENLFKECCEKIGNQVDEIKKMESEDIVIKPLHPVAREVDGKAQDCLKDIFPGGKDNGLIYNIFLSVYFLYQQREYSEEQLHDPNTYSEYINLDTVIKTYKRRDFPSVIRQRWRTYLESLMYYVESAPKQGDETYNNHRNYAKCMNVFIKRLGYEDLFEEFCKRIAYDLHDLKNGFPIKELIEYNEQAQIGDRIQWINPALIENRSAGSNKENEYYRPYMNRLLNPEMNCKPRLNLTDETIFENLAQKFPNFTEVIQFYKAQFRLNRFTQKERINPVLLLGEPGIGKTHFAKSLAKMLNTGYTFIDLASTTDSWVLSGLHASWRGGKPGKLFESMVNSPTISPVVLLDEVEKTSGGGGKGHDATTPLYQILEETNAREYVDEFIDIPADLSHLIVIACANSIEPLSEPLQSRFRIFTIPSPTEEQYYSILQSIYEDETAKSGVFEPVLPKEIIAQLLTCSIREAKVKIAEAIGQVLLELSEEQMSNLVQSEEKIGLKLQHINTVLHRQDKMGF
jgi:hypothetical protein